MVDPATLSVRAEGDCIVAGGRRIRCGGRGGQASLRSEVRVDRLSTNRYINHQNADVFQHVLYCRKRLLNILMNER
jgi:hypothetical protein